MGKKIKYSSSKNNHKKSAKKSSDIEIKAGKINDNLKNHSNNLISKKTKRSKGKIKKNYPGITFFNINSHFIYDLGKIGDFISSIDNKNIVKLNKEELKFIKDEIDVINKISNNSNDQTYVDISSNILDSINNFYHVDITENFVAKWVNDYIDNANERNKISLRKITELYNHNTGNNISKTKMFYIFKNKLKMRYLKTCVKNKKLQTPEFIFSCMTFIKILIRAIHIGFNIYFMDESDISLKNNNFRCWRKKHGKYSKIARKNIKKNFRLN